MEKINANKSEKKTIKSKKIVIKRTHKVSFFLNDKENEAVESYCKKYKVMNKKDFFRETIIKTILDRFVEDYPTLFEQQELDNLVVNQK